MLARLDTITSCDSLHILDRRKWHAVDTQKYLAAYPPENELLSANGRRMLSHLNWQISGSDVLNRDRESFNRKRHARATRNRWWVVGNLEQYLALMWRDLDLKKGTATIQRVLVRNRKGGGWSFQPTKTPGSRRCIPFPSYLLRKFKSHKRTQNETRLKLGSEWENNDLVFASGFRCALSRGCERNNAIFTTVHNQCRHIEVERQSAIPPDTSIL
jgi:hypothetical protein